MADRNNKNPNNVFGSYYNDLSCISCGTCFSNLPSVFGEDEDGNAIVIKQPESYEENKDTIETLGLCPVNAIGSDGLLGGSVLLGRLTEKELKEAKRKKAEQKKREEKERARQLEERKKQEEANWLEERANAVKRIESNGNLLTQNKWDVFVSYASEDKDFARELVEALENWGVRVWFDENVLQIGDSLRRSIDFGLANSSYGVLVVSSKFLKKEWTKRELDGFFSFEDGSRKVIIPIWHNVDSSEIRKISPTLSDRLSILSNGNIESIAEKIVVAILKSEKEDADWQEFTYTLPDNSEINILPICPKNGYALGIGRTLITNKQYEKFIKETNLSPPIGEHFINGQWVGPFIPWDYESHNSKEHPVTCVNFYDSQLYCAWVNNKFGRDFEIEKSNTNPFNSWGSRKLLDSKPIVKLPSTALWDFAAFGQNFRYSEKKKVLSANNDRKKLDGPLPVIIDSNDFNYNGLYDLFGNVWQWCSEKYEANDLSGYYGRGTSRIESPQLRGGGFLDDINSIRVDQSASILENGAKTRRADFGIRIACLLPIEYLPKKIRAKLISQNRQSKDFWDTMTGSDDNNLLNFLGRF